MGIASNYVGVDPKGTVRRWSKAERKFVNITCPQLVKAYNTIMGGTDQMDQNVNNLRISIRGKKFYMVIITWLIDVAVNNAWSIYRKMGNDCSQLKFKRYIVEVLLNQGNPPLKPGRPLKLHYRVNVDVRFDGHGHLLVPSGRMQCANCPSRVRSKCLKCDVGLCLKCNLEFHSP